MTGVTVEKFAEQIGNILPAKLIEQLNQAGVDVSNVTDIVTEDDRRKLLTFLKKEHGEEIGNFDQPNKISLKRQSISEIKFKNASGKSSFVSVVRKRRRIYVKKDFNDESDIEENIDLSNSNITENENATVNNNNEIKEDKDNKAHTVHAQSEEKQTKIQDINQSENINVTSDNNQKTDFSDTSKSDIIKQPNNLGVIEKTVHQTTQAIQTIEKPKPAADTTNDNKNRHGKSGKKWKKEHSADHQNDNDKRKNKNHLLNELDGSPSSLNSSYRKKGVSNKLQANQKSKKFQHKIPDKANPHAFERPTEPIVYAVKIPETITVAELASKMSVKAAEVIKIMMKMGIMATINQVIDQDTACLVVEELGHKAIALQDISIEESINIEYKTDLKTRPPIVTVMGHVDHGKTSLLDYIRRTRVTASESGGITQHIGAYQVTTPSGVITFLDTPGHSAFTAMRARGANCTDLVVLVVAADDGVMPQTIEAIQHAKAANVPIIVAINKIDKSEADIDRVTNELSQQGLIPESWGGDTMFVPVSSKVGTGIDDLLESIMVQTEILELSAAYHGPAQGVVLEARIDRGRGPVASILVQQGLLKKGDMLLAGLEYGRIKSMINDKGEVIDQASPATPVEVLGLSGIPQAGDNFQIVDDERKAREVALFRQGKHRDIKLARQQSSKLEGFLDRMQQGELKELNIILKADVQGSIEALRDSLEELSTSEIKVKVISQSVGGFNESDINLAIASGAVLIGFNVRAEASARKLAQQEGIEINYYSIIYDVIDGVKRAISGRLGPKYTQKIIGLAEVREVFRSTKIGAIAGCMVIEGHVKRNYPIRVLRNNVVIYEGELESLRRFKDNVNEVKHGMECGIGVKNYNDVKVGDQIEVFKNVEVSSDA